MEKSSRRKNALLSLIQVKDVMVKAPNIVDEKKFYRKITIAFKIGPDTKKDRINLSGCVKTISPSPDKELKFLARQECHILRETFKNRTYLEKFK